MGQLIRATMIPLKTIHFSQPGRLVSSDSIDIERRKAIARHNAMRANYASAAGANDYQYIQQINRTFRRRQTPIVTENNSSLPERPAGQTGAAQTVSPVSAQSSVPALQNNTPAASNTSAQQFPVQGISESQAAYTVQRGAFELRVAKGELSYLPPLDMTIIVQYPDVEFEYLGDFNYVPARDPETSGAVMNLNI